MNGISHVAIGVRDMERSLRFYRDLLGLEVRSDEMQPIGRMPTLYANPETGKRRAVNLRYGKGNDRRLFGFVGEARRNAWRGDQA